MRESAQIMKKGEPNMVRKHVLWIALLCLLLAGSTNVSARTITVGHTAGVDYWTIQEAVDAANLSGDAIQVMVGTYNENIVISKSLILQSDDKDCTIIEGGGSEIVVQVTANNAAIRGFTVQGGSTGVRISGNNNTVEGNKIKNPSTKGIDTSSSTNTTISNNIIENVSGGSTAYGIYLYSSTGTKISSNTIENVWGSHTDLNIYLDSSSRNTITNNTISAVCHRGFFLTSGSTMNHIYHNNIMDNTYNGHDDGGNNGWDNGPTNGGNYWGDYKGNDTDGDGIGDTTSYYISGGVSARDNYPFMEKDGWIDANTTPTPPIDLIPANDSDSDGVPNVWDADNNTPTGYWVNPQGIGRRWGDMNGDGVLTSVDALMILQAAVGSHPLMH